MSKKQDPDILALKRCVKALNKASPLMLRPTIEYLWDRFALKLEQELIYEKFRARMAEEQKPAAPK